MQCTLGCHNRTFLIICAAQMHRIRVYHRAVRRGPARRCSLSLPLPFPLSVSRGVRT